MILVSASTSDRSVAVSFGREWHAKIAERAFTSVIRRKVPSQLPDWIFIYANSPLSAFCARARIDEIDKVDLDAALRISEELSMSSGEIRDYLGNRSDVGLYRLGKIEVFPQNVPAALLSALTVFHPPQNFCYLTAGQVRLILDSSNG